MIHSLLHLAMFFLSLISTLQATAPDITNLDNCIEDVRQAALSPPQVPGFDPYTKNYIQLIADLQTASTHLPYIYQEAAAKPLIQFLENLGEQKYLQIFSQNFVDETLQQIIPDAVLAILFHQQMPVKSSSFQEVVSDLYDSFISEEQRLGKGTGRSINPPNYGVIPPLVKFGNAESGPYTWPGDATYQILGMKCAIVSLPPAQLEGGLLAWTALGHETGGHDIIHADKGLLEELAQKVHQAVLKRFKSQELANYWANCIDESVSDVCGYLNMGPSIGIGLIGYFRALGDGKLRTIGYREDPHPIDLLRGYLAAAVARRLHFKDATAWSQIIATETSKDNKNLKLMNANGTPSPFPVSLEVAIASTDVVAQAILRSPLVTLENHSLQEIEDWQDQDQAIVDQLVLALKTDGHLPMTFRGSGFYAAHVVAAATQAALQKGAQVAELFSEMQSFLAVMHLDNPVWSKIPTDESIALLEKRFNQTEAYVDISRSSPLAIR